jgi:hypothetical protein
MKTVLVFTPKLSLSQKTAKTAFHASSPGVLMQRVRFCFFCEFVNIVGFVKSHENDVSSFVTR